jgi:tetratricopeptide (TPR) repeat protein
LFIEELVEALFDEGVLARNGAVKVTRPLGQLKIPPTVEGILAARIDRLPLEAKELLQTLAVIGSEFPLTLVRQVVQSPADLLDRLLDVLQAGEFIYEQPATGDVAYTFKHALTHDQAYKSLLTERRNLLHERTGQAIETLYREQLEDHYAELAHHYLSSSNAAKAVEYLRLAGEQAVDRGAYAQTAPNAELALKLIERLPEGEQRLRAELGVRMLEARVAPALHGLASAQRLETSERVCELSEQLGDDSALLRGLFNVGFAYVGRGEVQRAQEIAQRCLALSEQNQDREMLPSVHLLAARCAYGSGDLLEARSRFNDLMKRLLSAPSRPVAGIPLEPWVGAPGMFALVEQVLGHPDQALKLSDEALRRAHQLKQPFALSSTLATTALVRQHRREPETVLSLAEARIALADEYGFRDHFLGARSLRGWAMIELGQTEQGIAELESGSALTTRFFEAHLRLAQVAVRVAGPDQALAKLDQVRARFEQSGAHLYAAELHRLKGEVILARDPGATLEAETCFRRAIEIAKGQSAKWWELRATMSLARLLRDTGRRDEARAMLSEVYNWFTEGFDTPDLKDAKALLEELGA